MQVQKQLAERMGKDFHMYSITLQPEADTPEVLAQYVEEMGIGPGWTFLTGRPEDVMLLRQNLGFYDPEEPELDSDLSEHLGFLLLGNEPYGWWGSVGSTVAPRQIVQLIDWMDPGSKGFLYE